MDISSRLVTTRVHTAVARTDEFRAVAILAAKRKLGIPDDAIVSADATVAEDGSITVELVEAVPAGADDRSLNPPPAEPPPGSRFPGASA